MISVNLHHEKVSKRRYPRAVREIKQASLVQEGSLY